MITKVTGKNQITIPAAIARELDIHPGTELEWHKGDRKNTIEIVVRPSPAEMLRQVQEDAAKYNINPQEFIGELQQMRAEEDTECDSGGHSE